MASFIGFAPADQPAVRGDRRARRTADAVPVRRHRGRAGVLGDHAVRAEPVRRRADRPRRRAVQRRRRRRPPRRARRARSRTVPHCRPARRPARARPRRPPRPQAGPRRPRAARPGDSGTGQRDRPIASRPTRPSKLGVCVQLHDLLDRLEIVEVRGHSDVRSERRDRLGDARQPRRRAGRAVLLHSRRPRRRSRRSRPTRSRRARRAAWWSAGSTSTCPQVRVRSRAGRDRPGCAHGSTATRREAMRVLGVTGTNGKTTTTYLLEAIAREAGERAGVIGTTGARIEATRAAVAAHDTGGDRSAGAARDDARRRCRDRRDGGVVARARPAPRRRHAASPRRRFTNLTHDHLDYHGSLERVLRRQGAVCSRPRSRRRAAIGIDDEHGPALATLARSDGLVVPRRTRSDATADVDGASTRARSRTARVSRSTSGDAARRRRVPARRPLQRAQRARAAATAARASASRRRRSPTRLWRGRSTVPGRMERVDAGQDFTVLVDYAHTPDALAVGAATRRAASSAPGGRLRRRVRLRRRSRPGQAAGHGRGRGRGSADVAIVTNDNPRSEDPGRDRRRRSSPAFRAGRTAPVVELDRRAAIRAGVRPARAGDVVVIAGKGHETGPDRGRCHRAVRRSRRRARGAEGARVTRHDRGRDRAPRAAASSTAMPTRAIDAWAFDSRALTRRRRASSRSGRSATVTTSSGAAFDAGRARRARRPRSDPPVAAGSRARRSSACADTLAGAAGRRPARCAPTVPTCTSSRSPARPGRRRPRTCSPPRSRRSAATPTRSRTTTSSGSRSRSATRRRRHGVVVTEMGERSPGDLKELCDIARPDVGVVTNVGLAHAEYLGGHDGDGRRS